MPLRVVTLALAAVLVVCCGCVPGPVSTAAESPPESPGNVSQSSSPAPSGSASRSASRPESPATSPAQPARPDFQATTTRIDDAMASRMHRSWRPGCPVPLADLRHVTVTYVDFDGMSRTGELVVHEKAATDLIDVFRALYAARFPIRSVRLVDDFGADDDRSMAADNTSAFNCRPSTGSPGRWSQHSYGRAVDINPRENPYVAGSTVLPPAGARFVNRSVRARGLVRPAGPVVRAFADIGWAWGGNFQRTKDYQHFSADGR